jgi:ribosome-associated heat shock protein Hsp15
MVRTRSAAASLVEAGYVRVNGAKIGATSYLLRAGDVVTVALDRGVRLLRVEAFSERRGGPQQAKALYGMVKKG